MSERRPMAEGDLVERITAQKGVQSYCKDGHESLPCPGFKNLPSVFVCVCVAPGMVDEAFRH